MIPKQAKVMVFTAPREVSFVDAKLPELGDGDVLVRSAFSGISHGTEMNVYRGHAPQWRKVYDEETRLFLPANADVRKPERGYWTAADQHWDFPLAYGYANVGTIVATGSKVEHLSPGDNVYAYRAHQTAFVAPASAVIPLPPMANPAAGVLYSNLRTAYNGVQDADIRIDDTVVVLGQGVVGLLVTRFVRRSGAATVIVVDRIEHRRLLGLQLGADLALDPDDGDIALKVRKLTGNRGADVVIEASGSYAALQEAIRTAAPNTTVVAMSWYGGDPSPLRLCDEFHHNRITIKSSQVGGVDPALSATHSTKRQSQQIIEELKVIDADPLLTTFIPFEEAARAYELIDQSPERVTQVVLSYE